jgi:ATP-dependent RNA circularization protein (DNA/RNA ligase family)
MQSRFWTASARNCPTTGFRYEVLTDDPVVRKAADDILLDFFGEENPYTLSEYTQKIGGI